MKSVIVWHLVLAMLFIGCVDDQPDIRLAEYLALSNETGSWSAVDTVSIYVGQDLFLLINGGAELYHQKGFVQVVTQIFQDSSGHQISIECYEMKSVEGSKSIYESKIAGSGEKLAIGDQAMLNSYYLNFYKGRFLVTLVGYDSDPKTLKGLRDLARAISRKIG
jgi:hypothetical protein